MPVHQFLNTLQTSAKARLRSVALPYENASLGVANVLLQHGFIHNFSRGTIAGPDPLAFNEVRVAHRRLWLDIKYGNDDRPVFSHAQLVSKPSRRIYVNPTELLRLVTGRRAQFINPLQLGEIAIVKTLPPGQELLDKPRMYSVWDQHKKLGALEDSAKAQHALTKRPDGILQLGESSTSGHSSDSGWASKQVALYMEAREAVGKGLSGELVARIG